METLYARLTWNRDNWRCPSGLIPRAEKGTYVAKRGFGHEEWLNRSEWTIDGWRYAYVEGVGRSPRLVGSKVKLVLFSINPRKRRVFVGEIRSAEVLTTEQAIVAHREFRRRGWISTMIAELEDLIGPAKGFRREVLSPAAVMNIRFRPSALQMFNPTVDVGAGHVLRRYSRYPLLRASADSEHRYRESRRRAMEKPRTTASHVRKAVDATEVDPIEAKMEDEVRQLLENRFGRDSVKTQEDFVDLRVTDGKREFLIELKSSTDARRGIRQALGQLLDYAFYADGTSKARLIAVSRGALTVKAARFVATLRRRFGIPIEYRQYVLGSRRFRL